MIAQRHEDFDGPGDHPFPDSPINWLTIGPDQAHNEPRDLDRWVSFLGTAYGLPPAIIPPPWHRHDELIWELSALHLSWLNAYHPEAPLTAPLVWHQESALARTRLRDWISINGARLDRDRPTRVTTWPGEIPSMVPGEVEITDRDADFEAFLAEDHAQRSRVH